VKKIFIVVLLLFARYSLSMEQISFQTASGDTIIPIFSTEPTTAQAAQQLIEAINQTQTKDAHFLPPGTWLEQPKTNHGLLLRFFNNAPTLLITPGGTWYFGTPVGNFNSFSRRLTPLYPYIKAMQSPYAYASHDQTGAFPLPVPTLIRSPR